jgi:thioredoxin-related protein
VVVVGLHTGLESLNTLSSDALALFNQENQITIPIGMDEWDKRRLTSKTMQAYKLQGTPSVILIDRQGRFSFSVLGYVSDIALICKIRSLLDETVVTENATGFDSGIAESSVSNNLIAEEQCCSNGSCG